MVKYTHAYPIYLVCTVRCVSLEVLVEFHHPVFFQYSGVVTTVLLVVFLVMINRAIIFSHIKCMYVYMLSVSLYSSGFQYSVGK